MDQLSQPANTLEQILERVAGLLESAGVKEGVASGDDDEVEEEEEEEFEDYYNDDQDVDEQIVDKHRLVSCVEKGCRSYDYLRLHVRLHS